MLARRDVDDGWPMVRAAEHFHVSWPTAKRSATRYAAMGPAGMADRSSRPHHSPSRTAAPVVRRIVSAVAASTIAAGERVAASRMPDVPETPADTCRPDFGPSRASADSWQRSKAKTSGNSCLDTDTHYSFWAWNLVKARRVPEALRTSAGVCPDETLLVAV